MALRDFQEKKKLLRAIYSWPTLIILTALIIWGLYGILPLWESKLELKKNLTEANDKFSKMRETRNLVEKRLESLKTSSGLDSEARGRFNLKKKGEEVVIFLDDGETNQNKAGIFNNFKFASIFKWIRGKLSF